MSVFLSVIFSPLSTRHCGDGMLHPLLETSRIKRINNGWRQSNVDEGKRETVEMEMQIFMLVVVACLFVVSIVFYRC